MLCYFFFLNVFMDGEEMYNKFFIKDCLFVDFFEVFDKWE